MNFELLLNMLTAMSIVALIISIAYQIVERKAAKQ